MAFGIWIARRECAEIRMDPDASNGSWLAPRQPGNRSSGSTADRCGADRRPRIVIMRLCFKVGLVLHALAVPSSNTIDENI